MKNRYQVQKVVDLAAYCLNWPESAWMGIFYFFVFCPKPPLKLFFLEKKLSSAYFKYNFLYFLFSELFCRMKLNFWGSGIWPEMTWESSQAVVKPKAYIIKNFAKWAQLLFRKSQESIITRDQPFVIYGGKTIGGGWISPPPILIRVNLHGQDAVTFVNGSKRNFSEIIRLWPFLLTNTS